MLVRSFRTAVVAAVALCLVTGTAATAGKLRTPTVKSTSGDLQSYVDDFVAGIPGRGSGGYDVPTDAERAVFAAAVDAVLAGDLLTADARLDPLAYDVVRFTDTATGDVVVLLRERRSGGRYPHAWGLFGFGRADSGLVVEVAHPVADAQTEDVGVRAFRTAQARALLVAGAHRYANGTGDAAEADVAHRTDSVFQVVHDRLLGPGVRVLQPHGFGEQTHDEVGHEVVVSYGDAPTTTTAALAEALGAHFSTCLYDGTACWQLGATRNVQGTSTRAAGGEFAHVESYTAVRTDPVRRDLLADTVARTLR